MFFFPFMFYVPQNILDTVPFSELHNYLKISDIFIAFYNFSAVKYIFLKQINAVIFFLFKYHQNELKENSLKNGH